MQCTSRIQIKPYQTPWKSQDFTLLTSEVLSNVQPSNMSCTLPRPSDSLPQKQLARTILCPPLKEANAPLKEYPKKGCYGEIAKKTHRS